MEAEPAESEPTTCIKERLAIDARDSLPQEVPTEQPGLMRQDISCLLRAWIPNVAKRLPRLIWSSAYYLLLLIHTGTNNTTRSNSKHTKSDNGSLQKRMKGTQGHKVALSPILPMNWDKKSALVRVQASRRSTPG